MSKESEKPIPNTPPKFSSSSPKNYLPNRKGVSEKTTSFEGRAVCLTSRGVLLPHLPTAYQPGKPTTHVRKFFKILTSRQLKPLPLNQKISNPGKRYPPGNDHISPQKACLSEFIYFSQGGDILVSWRLSQPIRNEKKSSLTQT